MMFIFELHGFRGLALVITPSQVGIRLGFITASAAATTFSEQVERHLTRAATKFAYIVSKLEANGHPGLFDEAAKIMVSLRKEKT